MDSSLLAQNGFDSLVVPAFIIICLAIVIWLLSWLLFPEPKVAPVAKSLEGLQGLDEAMAAKLRRFGIHSDRDLIRLSPRGQQELESQLGLHNGEYGAWRQSILDRWRLAYLPQELRDDQGVYPDPELGPLYSKKPDTVDDLARLDGIDRLTANRLNAAGIYTFQQLHLLTPEQRANFKRRFNLAGFDFAQVDTAKGIASLTTASAAEHAPHGATTPNDQASPTAASVDKQGRLDRVDPAHMTLASGHIKLDPELGQVYVSPPQACDDLTQLEGVDAAAAKRLNDTGIYRFDQLSALAPHQHETLKQRCGLSLSCDDLSRKLAGLTSGSAQAEAASAGSSSAGIAAAAAGTVAAGTAAAAAVAGLASRAGEHSGSTEMPITTGQSSGAGERIPTSNIDAELGRVYTAPPPHRDDLTQLEGIDANAAKRLNDAGVYTVDQLNSLSPSQQASFKQRFNLPDVDFAKWRLFWNSKSSSVGSLGSAGAGSGAASSSLAGSGSAGAIASSTSSRGSDSSNDGNDALTGDAKGDVGYVYVSPPMQPDDLTSLDGVDAAKAKELNDAGIYTFDQLRSLRPQQLANFKAKFGFEQFDFAAWLPQVASNTGHDAAANTSGSISAAAAAAAGVTAAAAKNAAQAGPIDSSLQSRQQKTVIGFAAGAATGGFDAGSNEDGGNQDSSGENNNGGGHAGSGSTEEAARETNTKIDDGLGRLYVTPPADRDDLTRLLGIDAAAALAMNSAGIYRFDQIKRMDDRQRDVFCQRFGLTNVDFVDWNRCINAWSRGIQTECETKRTYPTGWLHGVRLPQIARGVFDGQQLVAYPEQVVFRGSDPQYWGTSIQIPRDGVTRSLPAEAIRCDINYARIRRVDTRESVVTPITKGQLFAPGGEDNGWNGLCESFFGGRHLGIFSRDVPNEVETKFGIGGWGFGHRFDHNDQQEWAWNGRLLEPTAFEISVGHIGSQPGTVIFRGSDPTIWNQKLRDGSDRLANPISSVLHPVSFVRLVRVDTGQAVIVRCDFAGVLRRGENPLVGWNGLNEHFSGGHHLGVYHQDASQEVEIRFGDGGWGFGHPFEANDRQAYAWDGLPIPETVFEISVLEKLPEHLRHELLE